MLVCASASPAACTVLLLMAAELLALWYIAVRAHEQGSELLGT
jgi:hypothetical protein